MKFGRRAVTGIGLYLAFTFGGCPPASGADIQYGVLPEEYKFGGNYKITFIEPFNTGGNNRGFIIETKKGDTLRKIAKQLDDFAKATGKKMHCEASPETIFYLNNDTLAGYEGQWDRELTPGLRLTYDLENHAIDDLSCLLNSLAGNNEKQ